MELRIRQTRDKLETSRLCLEEVAVVESGLKPRLRCQPKKYVGLHLRLEENMPRQTL
jgi:hypothetical protein